MLRNIFERLRDKFNRRSIQRQEEQREHEERMRREQEEFLVYVRFRREERKRQEAILRDMTQQYVIPTQQDVGVQNYYINTYNGSIPIQVDPNAENGYAYYIQEPTQAIYVNPRTYMNIVRDDDTYNHVRRIQEQINEQRLTIERNQQAMGEQRIFFNHDDLQFKDLTLKPKRKSNLPDWF